MSIMDCRYPTSFGNFNFVQQVKQLTQYEHYGLQNCADVTHPLDLNFGQQITWFTQNEHL
jgi:hypothetical protein